MLVITRKESELIQIGEDVFVKVIQTGRGSIKIGIAAPGHVRVLRGEMSAELAALQPGQPLHEVNRPSARDAARESPCREAV